MILAEARKGGGANAPTNKIMADIIELSYSRCCVCVWIANNKML